MATSEEGRRLVTGGNEGTIRVRNVETREALGGPLCGHARKVTCLRMNADCSQVVSWGLR